MPKPQNENPTPNPVTRGGTRPTVLAAIDFTELGDLALDKALDLASGLHATPHVVTVGHQQGKSIGFDMWDASRLMSDQEAMTHLTEHVRARVEGFQQRVAAAGFDGVQCHIRLGEAAHEIAQLASDLEADVVVLGTHGRSGVKRLLLGSVAEKVVRLAPCPVFVVRPKESADARARIPEIEPPCPRCVEARRTSGGEQMWCEQHQHNLGRRHTYSFVSRNVEARINEPLLYPMGDRDRR